MNDIPKDHPMTNHATRLAEATALLIESRQWFVNPNASITKRIDIFLTASTSPIASNPAPPETKPAECRGSETQTAKPADAGSVGGEDFSVTADDIVRLKQEHAERLTRVTNGEDGITGYRLTFKDEAAIWGPCDHDMGGKCPRCWETDRHPIAEIVNALRADLRRVEGEREACAAAGARAVERADDLARQLKRYEPTHTFNGLTIDAWKLRAEQAEAERDRLAKDLHNARDDNAAIWKQTALDVTAERDRLKAEVADEGAEIADAEKLLLAAGAPGNDPTNYGASSLRTKVEWALAKITAERREVVVPKPMVPIGNRPNQFEAGYNTAISACKRAIVAAGGKIAGAYDPDVAAGGAVT